MNRVERIDRCCHLMGGCYKLRGLYSVAHWRRLWEVFQRFSFFSTLYLHLTLESLPFRNSTGVRLLLRYNVHNTQLNLIRIKFPPSSIALRLTFIVVFAIQWSAYPLDYVRHALIFVRSSYSSKLNSCAFSDLICSQLLATEYANELETNATT